MPSQPAHEMLLGEMHKKVGLDPSETTYVEVSGAFRLMDG
jgi:hypothetical protein